jgi:AcrR family transcriptional regulator
VDAAALAAARELLCEVGYAPTTIDTIARRAQVSRTALYRRWPSKALLVHEAVLSSHRTRRDSSAREGTERCDDFTYLYFQ